ncbi:MAG: hypothetical protein ABI268_08210, partial [Rhodanobacter sp.]
VDYLIRHEWARASEDVLWRRTKLGLRMSESEQAGLQAYMTLAVRRLVDVATKGVMVRPA